VPLGDGERDRFVRQNGAIATTWSSIGAAAPPTLSRYRCSAIITTTTPESVAGHPERHGE
jgi:hypothetical protein